MSIQDHAVLIDGTPQPVALALDLELHLVQVPFVTRAWASPAQSGGIARAEPRTPGTNRLVRDGHPLNLTVPRANPR